MAEEKSDHDEESDPEEVEAIQPSELQNNNNKAVPIKGLASSSVPIRSNGKRFLSPLSHVNLPKS